MMMTMMMMKKCFAFNRCFMFRPYVDFHMLLVTGYITVSIPITPEILHITLTLAPSDQPGSPFKSFLGLGSFEYTCINFTSVQCIGITVMSEQCYQTRRVKVQLLSNSVHCVLQSTTSTVIRPLSGTSTFSNDTVRFTSFFVYHGDRVCLHSPLFLGN